MTKRLELWAGPECSVVRVGDSYVDQIAATGHDRRVGDLERIASLGATTIRYPILWEKVAPGRIEDADWSHVDERLERIRALGMKPIVGLVHHGSGPRWTSLLEDSFETGLAAFAEAVARRYPWITDYTPVNEPLTTARFSALYGHWYPHLRSDAAFIRALLVQCGATRSAMRAIRRIHPHARLVQTEDCATVFSTPRLAYQARFENQRRFASLDILTGRLGRSHVLRPYFEHGGVFSDTLDSFVADPCPPDIIGLNYYVTSDRFLDERTRLYETHVPGGNGRETYCDLEAARVRANGIIGHQGVLELMANRYRRPVALTEVHIGCTPDEQMRWLAEAWAGALAARENGVDVRGVTAWSVFGAVDWDSLLVERRGHYEAGAFDVSGREPRETPVAALTRDLGTTGRSEHLLLDSAGWWRREHRLIYGAAVHPDSSPWVLGTV